MQIHLNCVCNQLVVFKDGLYTLELYGAGETKISCPSLSATEPEPTKSPPIYQEPQTEVPSKGVHHLTQSYNSGSLPDPAFPQNPEVPHKKPNEGPKDIDVPQMSYYPSYPPFFYHYPVTTAQPLLSPLTTTTEVQSKQTFLPSNLPKAPEGKIPQNSFPFYVWPSQPEQVPVVKETPVDSPATQPPNDEEKNPFYHYPYFQPPNFIPVQTPENPTMQPPVTKPPPDKFPEYVLPNHYPSGPTQKPQEPSSSKPENQEYKPQPVPPVSQGQIYQPLYPKPFYHPFWPHQPQMPTPTLAPKGQLNPEIPGNLSPSKPPTTPQSKVPSQPEAPAGEVQQQFYHYFYQPEPEKQPDEKPQPSQEPDAKEPAPTEHPPAVNPPGGNVYFIPYYPQPPHQITLPPTTATHGPQPDKKPSNDGNVQQGSQPGSPYMTPYYCPQFCPSDISNCCPQFAFHQHLHQFVPAGLGSNIAPVYPAWPSLSLFTTATPLQHFLPPQNEQLPYLLPPDGNNAVPVVNIPINLKPTYPHFVPNLYLQSQSAVNYNAPSGPQAPGNWQGNPHYIQSQQRQVLPEDMKNPSLPAFMPFGSEFLKLLGNQQREPRATELKQSNVKTSVSEEPMQAKVKSVADRFLVPDPILQDARAPIANSSQQFLAALKKSTNAQSKSYVLLQQGPPGRERNSDTEDLLADTTLQSQNLKPHHRNLNPLQDNPQFVSAMDGSHFAPLPKDSFKTVHMNPELLEQMWKLRQTLGYNHRIPAHAPGEEFQGGR